jgi:hypothetical protein
MMMRRKTKRTKTSPTNRRSSANPTKTSRYETTIASPDTSAQSESLRLSGRRPCCQRWMGHNSRPPTTGHIGGKPPSTLIADRYGTLPLSLNFEDIVALVEASEPKPSRRLPTKRRLRRVIRRCSRARAATMRAVGTTRQRPPKTRPLGLARPFSYPPPKGSLETFWSSLAEAGSDPRPQLGRRCAPGKAGGRHLRPVCSSST